MFRRIVVGFNATLQSEDGLALAIRLAAATNADLLLGYVYPQQPPWFSSERPYQRNLRKDIRGIFDRAQERIPDSLNVQTLALGSGSPARGLHDLATGERADLLVLGSTHRGPAGRVMPGTVAETVLTGAPCAVAIAPRDYRERDIEPISVVGAAFDGSPEAAATLGRAGGLAASLQSSLRAIAVAEPHWAHNEGDEHPLAEPLARALSAAGCAEGTDTALLTGHAAAALADAGGDVDLLVAGSRGYGPMHHVLLGSVSARLLRTCPCPLIVFARSVVSAEPDTDRDHEPQAASDSGSGSVTRT